MIRRTNKLFKFENELFAISAREKKGEKIFEANWKHVKTRFLKTGRKLNRIDR